MHLVPVIDKANHHISGGCSQAYEQKPPLIGRKVKNVARCNTGDDDSNGQRGTTYQRQFYRFNFSSARRKRGHIGAMGTRFKFTTAKLGK